MKSVFKRTISRMFNTLSISIHYGLVLVSTLILALIIVFGNDYSSIAIQKIDIQGTFTILNFLWLSGFLLMLKVAIVGSGLFSSEESSGTIRLLFARPLKRSSIIIGKILGFLTGSIIYMITSLILSITLYALITQPDKDVLISLIKIVPNFIIYGIFIILFFGGISCMFSALFKRVPSLIIMILLVLLTIGILPIGRLILTSFNKYEKLYLYYVDANYHIGSMYIDVLQSNDDFVISPYTENSLNVFTNAYSSAGDPDKTEVYARKNDRNNLINTSYLFIIYSLVAFLSYTVCFINMNKKDIN